MHQQSKIPEIIHSLSTSTHLSQAKKTLQLATIVKHLHEYTTNPQSLPPSENFIPFCLFKIPDILCNLLNITPNDLLEEKPVNVRLRIAIGAYLKAIGRLVVDCDQDIKHIVVQSMGKSILIAAAFPSILKKWIKTLLELWSTTPANLQVPLRCHLTLAKYLQHSPANTYMWALRRCYISYFENSKQISMRNYEHINFMVNCFCQLVKLNKQRAYYVLFGYLRSLSLELDKLNKLKKKDKIQATVKLFSNQVLGCFKLLVGVVCRVDGEELTALIYPLCQIISAYERITDCPEYMPLKLHLLEYQLTIIQSTSVYIPHCFHMLEKLLSSATFSRKLSKKSQNSQANLQLAYKVSKKELMEALLVNEIFNRVITNAYWFVTLMEKNVYGVQILMKFWKVVKGIQFGFSQYRIATSKLAKLLKHDYEQLYDSRLQQKLSIQNTKKINKFEKTLDASCENSQYLLIPAEHKKLKADQEQLLRNKLSAQLDPQAEAEQQDEEKQGYINQDEDEVNSGWEEASEGASELDMNEIVSQEQGSEDKQEISYEGDPEDIEQVENKWEQEQWSSQGN